MKSRAGSIYLALLLTAVLALGLAGAGSAQSSSVIYEGGAEKFVFLADDDLFDNFKGVLPGDVIEQKITVKNTSGGRVRIYMRVDPVSEADRDFLNQMHLNVKADSNEIFDAQADQRGALTSNTLLGTFKTNGSTELTVILTVPVDLGNRYMSNRGTVPWVFLAEEVEDDSTPETGDWFNPILWGSVFIALAGGAVWLVTVKRRRGRG